MKMSQDEIYRTRKQFFNDNAESWLDTWYRNQETGQLDRHQKDFDRLFDIVPLEPGDHVLDAGCGSGVLVPMILQRITPAGLLYELDYAERMIEVNKSLHEATNIRFIVADVADAPLGDASCNVILCFSCFPHFHDKERALRTMSRILKTGGRLVIAHFESLDGINKHHASCHAVAHDHLPGEPEMRGLISGSGLRVEKFIDEPGFYCLIALKPLHADSDQGSIGRRE